MWRGFAVCSIKIATLYAFSVHNVIGQFISQQSWKEGEAQRHPYLGATPGGRCFAFSAQRVPAHGAAPASEASWVWRQDPPIQQTRTERRCWTQRCSWLWGQSSDRRATPPHPPRRGLWLRWPRSTPSPRSGRETCCGEGQRLGSQSHVRAAVSGGRRGRGLPPPHASSSLDPSAAVRGTGPSHAPPPPLGWGGVHRLLQITWLVTVRGGPRP